MIPVGLEYLVSPLEGSGHPVEVCDLTFSEDPVGDLLRFLAESKPDVVGFSVRNVDTVVFGNNVFFLDDVALLVEAAADRTGAITVAGGSASLCSGAALRAFLGVDHLVRGPGELAFPELLGTLERGGGAPEVTDGWSRGIAPRARHPRGLAFDYGRYLEGGHPAGLEFRKGCPQGCRFCIERRRAVLAREVASVVAEARSLAEAGAGSVFMCDSEVNIDLGGTLDLLGALADEELGLRFNGYFRPSPFDARTAGLLSRAGFGSLTVSTTSLELWEEGGPTGRESLAGFSRLCESEGIRVAVDLLVGYPGESLDSVERSLDFLSGVRPATVGVNPFIRLYEETPASLDAGDGAGKLQGVLAGNESRLRPVFYLGIDVEWLESRLAGDPLFVLEGTRDTVNYQRT